MTRRLLKLISIAVLAAAAMPAGAGPANISYSTVRGVAVVGAVSVPKTGIGRGAVTFFELEGGAMQVGIQILPLPTAPDPTTLQPAPITIGCIKFTVKGKTDQGCEVVSHYVNLDPLLQDGAFTFAVESDKFEGSQLRATLLLTGEGAPTPAVTPSEADEFAPPYGRISARAVLSRSATTVGTIVSDGLGLGTPEGVLGGTFREPAAEMFSGVEATFTHGPGCLLAVGVNCVAD